MPRKLKIAQVGTYPPPAGGRSIHMRNLAQKLCSSGNKVTVFDTQPDVGEPDHTSAKYIGRRVDFRLLWILLFNGYDIVHVHFTSWRFQAVLAVLSKFRKTRVIYTLHSFRDELDVASGWKRFLIKTSLSYAYRIICINEDIRKKVFSIAPDAICEVVSPFIFYRETVSQRSLPPKVKSFMENKTFAVVACASATTKLEGVDLYGLDMIIDLAAFFKKKKISVSIVVIITDVTNRDYFNSLNNKIIEQEVGEIVMLYEGRVDFNQLLKISDLFVRPTTSDSFGLSLADAHICGVHCIASDVCERPTGTLVYKSRNQIDFNFKCINTLLGEVSSVPNVDLSNYDGFARIQELYTK